MKILSVANTKIVKGEKLGYKTYGIHLAPHTLSGKNVCPNASKGCATACLNGAGFGYYQHIQDARFKKTQWFFNDRAGFLSQMVKEVTSSVKSATKKKLIPCFRLNLTSDIAWESIKVEGKKNIMELFPDVNFYDYTKSPSRMTRFVEGKMPANYHLTFSRSETNQDICKAILKSGGNVAIVFRNRLPKTWMGFKVIDGTESDVRFIDKKKCVVGLVELGPAKKDKTGFVVTHHLKKCEKKSK